MNEITYQLMLLCSSALQYISTAVALSIVIIVADQCSVPSCQLSRENKVRGRTTFECIQFVLKLAVAYCADDPIPTRIFYSTGYPWLVSARARAYCKTRDNQMTSLLQLCRWDRTRVVEPTYSHKDC